MKHCPMRWPSAIVISILVCSFLLVPNVQAQEPVSSTFIYLPYLGAGAPTSNSLRDADSDDPLASQPESANPSASEQMILGPAAPSVYDRLGDWRIKGDLGVGTDTPGFKVDVRQYYNGAATMSVRNRSKGTSTSSRLLLDTGYANMLDIRKYGANYAGKWNGITLKNWARIRAQGGSSGLIVTTGGADPLILGTNDIEHIRLTSSGRLGIGTKTPHYKVDIDAVSINGMAVNTDQFYAVVAESTSSSSTGVFGIAGVKGIGVHGTAGAGGTGVYGIGGGSGKSYGGYFTSNSSDGIGAYVWSRGQTRDEPALRVDNTRSWAGMATYMTNQSNYATAHFQNDGSGEVLFLNNGGANGNGAGGGSFIKASSAAPYDLQFQVTTSGQVRSDSNFVGGGADYADMLAVTGRITDYEPGDVLVLAGDAQLTLSSSPNSTAVVGVYSTQPALIGDPLGVWEDDAIPTEAKDALAALSMQRAPVAMAGVVPVKVTAENGSIAPGDLLTTSSTPGHAMKALPVTIQGVDVYQPGTIIGKAMTSLDEDEGVVEMIVMMQ